MRSALRRLRLPGLRVNFLSGHRAARSWLFAAAAVVAVALLVLLWGTFKPDWGPLPTPTIGTAAAWVTFLGVCATVIAIVAAYVELRTIFPPQGLNVTLRRGPNRDDLQESSWVVFTNDVGRPIINTFRLEVRLEYDNNQVLPVEGRSDTHDGWEPRFDDGTFYHHWTKQANAPFFPGTTITAPWAPVEPFKPFEKASHWRATWWTDRAGPQEVVLPIGD